MSPKEIRGPDLAAANESGLEYVVIGGFAVIANGHLRATKDSDLLVPDGEESASSVSPAGPRILPTSRRWNG